MNQSVYIVTTNLITVSMARKRQENMHVYRWVIYGKAVALIVPVQISQYLCAKILISYNVHKNQKFLNIFNFNFITFQWQGFN